MGLVIRTSNPSGASLLVLLQRDHDGIALRHVSGPAHFIMSLKATNMALPCFDSRAVKNQRVDAHSR